MVNKTYCDVCKRELVGFYFDKKGKIVIEQGTQDTILNDVCDECIREIKKLIKPFAKRGN